MEVTYWENVPGSINSKGRRVRRHISPTLIGILSTLLLHALVIQSLPFGSGRRVRPPYIQEPTGLPSQSEVDSTESLVLMTLPTGAKSDAKIVQDIALGFPKVSRRTLDSSVMRDPPTLVKFESLTLGDEHAVPSKAVSGDGAELARLYGIYTGQIRARIDRIWRRPRTPVRGSTGDKRTATVDEAFQCEAQVVQDGRGDVQEILLVRCNGSYAWQHSLVLAIQQASPLPDPPSPSVFSRSITISFIALPYVDGISSDEYETEVQNLAQAD